MAQKLHWTSLYFPSNERYISELEILNDKLEVQLKSDLNKIYTECLYPDFEITFEDGSIQTHSSILKCRAPTFFSELSCSLSQTPSVVILSRVDKLSVENFVREIYTQNKIREKEILIVEYLSKLRQLKEEVLSPESDIYVTPQSSPTDIKVIFGHSNCTSEGELSSLHHTNTLYYSLVTVDPVDIFEKELAEQDQLFKSFKSIISKESKNSTNCIKPFTLSSPLLKSQYSLKYPSVCKKRKLLDVELCVNPLLKYKCSTKHLDNSAANLTKNVGTPKDLEKVLSYKSLQEGLKETNSATDMSKTKVECEDGEGPDSFLEPVSSDYLTSTSPRDYTASVSESTAVATSEDIPHDSDRSARSSSMSSDAGTWEPEGTGVVKAVTGLDSNRTGYDNICYETTKTTVHQDESKMLFQFLEEQGSQKVSQVESQSDLIDYKKYPTVKSCDYPNDMLVSKSALGSQTLTNFPDKIELDYKDDSLPENKNFFINAASLLDENEMNTIHPNSLNNTNEVIAENQFMITTETICEIKEHHKVDLGNQQEFREKQKMENCFTNTKDTPTDQIDLEMRRSSLIRRNTFELELDDERLAALRKECEKHKLQQNNWSSSSITPTASQVIKSPAIDRGNLPNYLPELIYPSRLVGKCDDDMHSPDSLNNDGPFDSVFEKDNKLFACYSLPFDVNNGPINKQVKEKTPRKSNCFSNGFLTDTTRTIEYDTKVNDEFINTSAIFNIHKTNKVASTPIFSEDNSLKDVSSDISYPSPLLTRRKGDCLPILIEDSIIQMEPETEPNNKHNSCFSSSWIVDMCEGNKPLPEETVNHVSNTLSSVLEMNADDSQKSNKSNNSSLGFFVSLDDPLDEKSSGDSGYKSIGPVLNKDSDSSRLKGDTMSNVTNLSSCSSSCGFYVDLKDTEVVVENPNNKESSGPDKKLFSMFIDIGDSGGSEETRYKTISPHLFKKRNNLSHLGVKSLKREDKNRFSDSQISSESSLEVTDSPDMSREKQSLEKELDQSCPKNQDTDSVNDRSNLDDKNKKQGFYMFIESEQVQVPQKRNLPLGLVPASQRHSWNSDSYQITLPSSGNGCDSVPKKTHKRSHSVTINNSVDASFNVENNENKSSSVSPLVKVSTSNSIGYESGPSSIDDTASKNRGMMPSWHGSVRPSLELQKVIARSDSKDRRERRFPSKIKSPLDQRSNSAVDEMFKSIDKSEKSTSTSSKGEDFSNDESSITDKHGNSTFIMSDISNVANATSNDLEITTPTCDAVSQLSKDDNDKTEIDFDNRACKKSVDIPSTPDHSTSISVAPTSEDKFNFVKLSDMDKEPKKMPEQKMCANRMSRSIPEASWIESKMMTRSATSRSLSRLFPHLNTSARNLTPDSAEHDTDFSEISSMQSSMDPSALEGSTEETDASSCANGPVSRLGEDLLRMFLDEISPDVTVEVGGRRIKAHKCILSSRCQYFAAILSGGWVESAGNVISLQGFSYSAVHFALCHIYSGASNIPDSINVVELATLADMLCLEGLKEVIMYTLKVKYCHFFHKPCPMCTVGVLECLPLAAAYGLDEIYRKSLRWINKYFVRVWPTKGFASLPRELLDKCYKQHIVHMTVENVLETVMCCAKLQGLIPNVRWAEPVFALATKLHDAAVKFIAQNFYEILSCDVFMALGKEQLWTMSQLEEALLSAAERLPPDQACKCHSHLYKLSSVIHTPESALVVKWNDGFVEFLSLLSSTVETCLLKQAARASRTPAWTLMEPKLRHKIQDAACLVIVPGDDRRRARHLLKRGEANNAGKRAADVLQSKLMVTDASTTKRTPVLSRTNAVAPAKPKTPQAANKSDNGGPRPKTWPHKISEVKSRYLQPKAMPKKSPALANLNKPEKPAITRRSVNKTIISSSDSSRTSSPAMRRSVPQRTSRSLPSKETQRDNHITMSTDSLAEPSNSGAVKKTEIRRTNQFSRADVEKTIRSHSVKPSGTKVTTAAVNECKGKPSAVIKVESDKPKYSPIPLSKRSSCQSSPRVKDTVNSTPSPSTRQIVLSPKERSHVTSDTKSTLLKRNTTYRVQGAKPLSPTKTTSIKPANLSPLKGNVNKIQSKVTSCKKSIVNNNTVANNRKTEIKPQPLVGSRSGTFLKDEPTVLKKPQVVKVTQ